jgi:hypothetical protein
MSTYFYFQAPVSTVDGLESDGVWFERMPDLSDDLAEEPYNFFTEAAAFLSVVGSTADMVTISVAARDIARVLKSLPGRLHKSSVAIEVRGPRGTAKFEIESPSDEDIMHMAALIKSMGNPIAPSRGTASLPPSPS